MVRPRFGSCLLQRLLRHEGVRNAGRATGRGDDVKLSHVSLLLEYSARGLPYTRFDARFSTTERYQPTVRVKRDKVQFSGERFFHNRKR